MRQQNRKGREMIAFLKSDLVRNFVGGFIIGMIGILTLQHAETNHYDASPKTVAQDSAKPIDRAAL